MLDKNEVCYKTEKQSVNNNNFEQKDIISLFEKQVTIKPQSIAAVYKEQKISYEKLNQNANRIAHYILQTHVKQEQAVAVLANRSIDFLSCMLAIFKVGGAYMPINPSFPENRIIQMIEQSQVKTILVEKSLFDTVSNMLQNFSSSINLLIIEDVLAADMPDCNLNISVPEQNLAYIIFTSGSTGKPKGAMLERIGMAEHLYAKIKDMDINSSDRVAQIASQCFDISLWQFLTALCVGGEVHIIEDEIVREPKLLLEKIKSEEVTVMQVVPSMLRTLVQYLEANSDDADLLSSVRWLALVGEALPPILCRKWFKMFNIPLLNSYGPTECSDGVSHYLIYDAPDESVINMSIGKEIQNLKVYVLEPETFNEVPFGEIGELCVSGTGVGRGYINDIERTEKVFFKNPFSADERYSRLYKTGDLVKYQPDGNLEYLGRIDRQVKIRGFRIELPEIESYILKFAGIKACAVVPQKRKRTNEKIVAREILAENKNELDDIRLVAYIISDSRIKEYELQDYLRKYLPGYMVPDKIVKIDEFPLNSNGKLDVKALPEPENVRPDLEVAYIEPRTETEIIIADIWKQFLGLDKVGRMDKFLNLGGDSLLAMRTLNRMEEKLDVKLSFDSLFSLNVEALALSVEENKGSKRIVEARETKDGVYPLSMEQQRLWFLWKLEKDNPFYILQGLVEINGSVNIDLIKQAWLNVIRKHDGLRARFIEVQGSAYQKFLDIDDIDMQVEDISSQESDKQAELVKEYARYQVNHPFDLEHEPLYRLKAFKINEDKFQIIFSTHEIVMDAWSLSVIMRQIKNECKRVQYSDNPINFRHYVLWEKDNISKEKMYKQMSYWKNNLSGKLPVLNMPKDCRRPEKISYKGSSEGIIIDKEVSRKLRQLGAENGATLYISLLSAYAYTLCKYTGNNEVIIGSPHVNRNVIGTENLVGFFLNMLPFRINVNDGISFVEYLNQVKDTVINGFANSNYPFMWMVEQSDTIRDGSNSPVFQTMFNMYSEKAETVDDGSDSNVNITFRELETGFTKYELTLYAQEQGDSIYLQFSYFNDIYTADFIKKLINNLAYLLEKIVENPNASLEDLDCVSPQEKKLLANDINNTSKDYDYNKTITQLFEDQVAKTPDSVAYFFRDKYITYKELNYKANQLASYLSKIGVQTGTRIAIAIERSFDMLEAMFGVMKLGAVYVPLDTEYPINRLTEILKDTNAKFLIITSNWDKIEDYNGCKINYDVIQCNLAEYSSDNLPCRYTTEDTLNIIYTSSSTGKPKGVKVSGRSVLNRLYWMWNEYPFKKDDVALYHKSYALVAATWECFGGLLRGIPTLMLDRNEIIDPARLWENVVKHKVTYFLATPAMLQGILNQAEIRKGEWESLRLATTSAEPIPLPMVERWQKLFKNVPLLNLYGSTECSSNALVFDTGDINPHFNRVPVGKPLSNTQAYILDERERFVPYGAVGELCISGDCVAQGYVDEELSKSRFVKSDINGKILYKTGDMARYLTDGNIELVGRKDFQVKIRGFRIEPGDIELALLRNAKIKKCAVKAFENDEQDKFLAAFIVAEDKLSVQEIRKFLEEHLPDYMIPASYVFMDSLPLTTTGKVDRKLLIKPEISIDDRSDSYVAPETDVQRYMVELWGMLLHKNNVGIKDNFFELGGHSLTAVQIVARVHQQYDIELPIRTILENPTIEGLALKIEELATNCNKNINKAIRHSTVKDEIYGEIPLTCGQSWYFNIMESQKLEQFNIGRLFKVESGIDANILKDAVTYLFKIHDTLRAVFIKNDCKWIQNIKKFEESKVPFYHIKCEDVLPEDESRFIEEYAEKVHAGFFIENDILLNVSYLDFGNERDGRILIVAHHLIMDGASIATFVNDLEDSYLQLKETGKIKLIDGMITIKDYVEELGRYIHSEEVKNEVGYWVNLPWDKVKYIPLDYPQNIKLNTFGSVETVSVSLTEQETELLLRKVTVTYDIDVDNILLWAISKCFSNWTNSEYVEITVVKGGFGMVPQLKNIDLVRTLGWKSSSGTLLIKASRLKDIPKDIDFFKKQLSEIPNEGYGFHLVEDMLGQPEVTEKLRKSRKDEILYNYRGAINSRLNENGIFRIAKESSGLGRDKDTIRFNEKLAIDGAIIDNKIELKWRYSPNISNRNTIERQANNCLSIVKWLIESVKE